MLRILNVLQRLYNNHLILQTISGGCFVIEVKHIFYQNITYDRKNIKTSLDNIGILYKI